MAMYKTGKPRNLLFKVSSFPRAVFQIKICATNATAVNT